MKKLAFIVLFMGICSLLFTDLSLNLKADQPTSCVKCVLSGAYFECDSGLKSGYQRCQTTIYNCDNWYSCGE